MIINKEQINQIIQQARNEYPKEVCGIVAGIKNKAKKIFCMKNISDKPELCYLIAPEEQLKVFKELRNSGFELLGIYHSHTKSEAYPSKRDIEMAYYPEAAYLIISLKDLTNPVIKAFKIIEEEIKEENLIYEEN